jgi:hypothetical protein
MMMLLLGFQVLLMGIGLWWMIAKRLHYAGYEILTPANFFMGTLLFFQLPMCFFIGTSAGAAEAIRGVMARQQAADTKKMQQKYWWIDPAVTGGAILVAIGIGAVSVRPEQLNMKPHEAPIGVRDYVFDYKQQAAQEHRRMIRQSARDEETDYDEFADDHVAR